MRKNSIHHQYLPISAIKPSLDRVRRHNVQQQRKLAKSIAEFGQVTPIIVDQNQLIVDGQAIFDELSKAGYAEVSAIVVSGLQPGEIRQLRLALNRIPQDAIWDKEKLEIELSALLTAGFDLNVTGFEVAEIDAIFEIDTPKSNIIEDTDEIPSRPPLPTSKKGDIWLCGDHRVACGDALDANAIGALTGGEPAAMAFCDPPYNVRVDGFVSGLGRAYHREFVQASGELSEDEFQTFLRRAFETLRASLREGAVAFICIDWRHYEVLAAAARASDLIQLNLCVWTKTNAGMGSLYRSQHELILVFVAGTSPHRNNVELGRHGRHRSNVWSYRGMNSFGAGRDDLLAAHPTVKPTAMIADAIRDVTRRKESVLDTFLGSGSTLIAAEETGRRCFGLDLDPGYVDVAVSRWEKLTGRNALHTETGEPFIDRAAPKKLANDGAKS